tara:strand:- start:26321 stop:27382 length:1062 start_codon:yes stop_codon:yes gene_type:complete
MGILDKKTRFIDLVVTQEGKRQIAAGKLRAEFASLSDCNAFYEKGEEDSVAERLYFEAMERPENSIVLEKDDSGRLFTFNFSPTGSLVGNDIFVKDTATTDALKLKPARGADFKIGENSVLDASLRHFVQNYFIGTDDNLNKNEFEVEPKEITFSIENGQPFEGSPLREIINVNDADPFFLDAKLAHLSNFQFLPPKNSDGTNYGTYTDIRSTSREEWNDIKVLFGEEANLPEDTASSGNDGDITKNLAGAPGYLSQKLLQQGKIPNPPGVTPKQFETINFLKTSTDNNLLVQIYEDSIGATMTKLDIVDAGVFTDNNDVNRRYEKRVFYVGKVMYDELNVPTFINIFTIVMD